MTLYRILENLDCARKGTLNPLRSVSEAAKEKLTAAGLISPVSPPPLAVLDGWEGRAVRLARRDISDAVQFLEADPADLARMLRVKAAQIETWKAEIEAWLLPG